MRHGVYRALRLPVKRKDNDMTPAEALRAAADLLAGPWGVYGHSWTQGARARAWRNGALVPTTSNDVAARCWCAMGAIERVLGTEDSVVGADALEGLRAVLPAPTGDDGFIRVGNPVISIGCWNDGPERTVAEVYAKLCEAADAMG